ncbi:MAG TPA: MXAN_6640 family putative metalloprotease [Candidatus Krumholzibacteria bacterium]|nr:MXAN_6640 family putative metalloprotease [Candidatus Krumholzibacteria bacterium]
MRAPLPAVTLALALLALLPSRSTADNSAHVHRDPALVAIESDRDSGRIDGTEALMLQLRRVFEPESLPALYRDRGVDRPVRCATLIVAEAQARRDELSAPQRAAVDAWLTPRTASTSAEITTSPQGRFQLEYETTGTDAVPPEDSDPANGVPDFVDRVGLYFEESWDREFTELGFAAPDISEGPYRVVLRRIGAYGFAQRTDVGSAGTFITVHHNFYNFPPNDDPEGNVWGAAKVTAAHELKHASQFANNGWTEPGLWVEIDATWTEDVVYDQVNDFYNYLTFGSPITAPTAPLDDGGSGAYAESVWQHWMSESVGIASVVTFWLRRADAPQEPVMDSYDWTLAQFGRPVAESWVDFATWNLVTGDRARPEFGYEEATGFPTAPLTEERSSVPASFSGSIERLAANFLRAEGFSAGEPGVVTITPQVPSATPLRGRAVIERPDGSWTTEGVDLGPGTPIELATPLDQIEAVTLVLGHGTLGAGTAVYEVTIDEEIRRPVALPRLDADEIRFRISAGNEADRSVALYNEGPAGSALDYEALIVAPVAPSPARSIAGSSLEVGIDRYEPASTTTLQVRVDNASTDFEWLQAVELDFPAGVRVVSSTDLFGAEQRKLVSNGATGDGAAVIWTDPDGAWGNIRNGEAGTATVTVEFALRLQGDLVVPYRIVGDGFGSGPSSVSSAVLLRGPQAAFLEITSPVAPLRTGEEVALEWVAAVDGDVALDLSRDGGQTWETLSASTPNDSSFTWTVTGPATFDARLRLRDAGDPDQFVDTDTPFAIVEPIAWGAVANTTGSIPGGQQTALQLDFDARGLDPGDHSAELVVFSGAGTDPLRVPVVLTVSADGTSSPAARGAGVVHGARPNPFNPETRIELELDRPTEVRIDLYDSRGRHVRTLTDTRLDTGLHAVPWSGRDTAGRRVASGVYLYVVQLDGIRSLGKVSLVE